VIAERRSLFVRKLALDIIHVHCHHSSTATTPPLPPLLQCHATKPCIWPHNTAFECNSVSIILYIVPKSSFNAVMLPKINSKSLKHSPPAQHPGILHCPQLPQSLPLLLIMAQHIVHLAIDAAPAFALGVIGLPLLSTSGSSIALISRK